MTHPSCLIDATRAQIAQDIAIMKKELLIWTVYDHPKDDPDSFIARAFLLDMPLTWYLRADTLDGLRAQLPHGLLRLERSAGDDPVIVESWL